MLRSRPGDIRRIPDTDRRCVHADTIVSGCEPTGLLTAGFEMYRRTVMTDFSTRIGMIRRCGVFSVLLLLAFFSTIPHGFSVGDGMKRSANAATAPNKRVANSIRVTNAS